MNSPDRSEALDRQQRAANLDQEAANSGLIKNLNAVKASSNASIQNALPQPPSTNCVSTENILDTGDKLVPGVYASELIMPSGEKLVILLGGSWTLQSADGKLLAARPYIPYKYQFAPSAETLDNNAKLSHVGPFEVYTSEREPLVDRWSAHWILHYPNGDMIMLRDMDGQVSIERGASAIDTPSSATFYPGLNPDAAPPELR